MRQKRVSRPLTLAPSSRAPRTRGYEGGGIVRGGRTAAEKTAHLNLSCTAVLIVNPTSLSSLQKQNACTAICITQTASPLPHSRGFNWWNMRRLYKIHIVLQLRRQILHCLRPLCVWNALSRLRNENNGPQIIHPDDSETRERYRPATAVAPRLNYAAITAERTAVWRTALLASRRGTPCPKAAAESNVVCRQLTLKTTVVTWVRWLAAEHVLWKNLPLICWIRPAEAFASVTTGLVLFAPKMLSAGSLPGGYVRLCCSKLCFFPFFVLILPEVVSVGRCGVAGLTAPQPRADQEAQCVSKCQIGSAGVRHESSLTGLSHITAE